MKHILRTLTPALALALAVPAAAQSYTVTNLGTLGGDSQANAVSATGTAVCTSLLPDGMSNGTFLAPGGSRLPSLGGANTVGLGIVSGATTQVVGYSDTADQGTQHAFLYTTGGAGSPSMLNLGTLSGVSTDDSAASGINALGQIVGVGVNSDGFNHAFRTAVGQTALTPSDDLGTLGGTFSAANAINASGQTVGDSSLAGDAVTHAFLTAANGTITASSDLGTLSGGSTSSAAAINTAGQVVGDSTRSDGSDHAVLWTQGTGGTTITDIGVLGTGDNSGATGINNRGSVVGFSNLTANGSVFDAFLFQNGKLFDLNNLISASSGWTLEGATAINDAGQIVGFGLLNGVQRAFLLNPTAAPEPSSLLALALGVTGTAGLVARKRRSVAPAA